MGRSDWERKLRRLGRVFGAVQNAAKRCWLQGNAPKPTTTSSALAAQVASHIATCYLLTATALGL